MPTVNPEVEPLRSQCGKVRTQICEAIGWRPVSQPPAVPSSVAAQPQLALLLGGCRQPTAGISECDLLLEEPILPPPRRTAAGTEVAATGPNDAFECCLQSASASWVSDLKDMPAIATTFSILQEAAVLQTIPKEGSSHEPLPEAAGAQAVRALLTVPSRPAEAGGSDALKLLEEPLFAPLTVRFASERAIGDDAVPATASFVATCTGIPAAAAVLMSPALPRHFVSYNHMVSTTMLGADQQSAMLPYVHIDDAVGNDANVAESNLEGWQELCAQCGIRRMTLATVELKLDWSLTGPPGSGVSSTRHMATPQVL